MSGRVEPVEVSLTEDKYQMADYQSILCPVTISLDISPKSNFLPTFILLSCTHSPDTLFLSERAHAVSKD